MRNVGRIWIGLIIFLAAVTFPFWYNAVHAASPPVPDLDPATLAALKGRGCVEPVAYMRSSHMALLNRWRDQAVRQGDRTYVASDGQTYAISLEQTCLDCHADGRPAGGPGLSGFMDLDKGPEFCASCHTAAGVAQVDCWNCHVATGEVGP